MNFNFIPVAGTKNRVIVEPAPAETKTASGLYIPDTAQEKPQRGTVISVSEKDEDGKTPQLKAGDKIMFGKYSGTEITLGDKNYLIMRESDILVKEI
ncbi:MAG: co-chaperone GroES [Flavobacteriales bacterium]|jgi:chaperonin GroES